MSTLTPLAALVLTVMEPKSTFTTSAPPGAALRLVVICSSVAANVAQELKSNSNAVRFMAMNGSSQRAAFDGQEQNESCNHSRETKAARRVPGEESGLIESNCLASVTKCD
jgi:hypothetical protein